MTDQEVSFTNAFETTLSAELDTTSLSMSLTDATGLDDTLDGFYLVLEPDSSSQREFVHCTAVSGNTVTIGTRYLAGSAAPSGLTHPVGSTVRMTVVAQAMEDLHDRVDAAGDHGGLTGLTDDDHTQYLKEKASGGTAAEVPTHNHSAAGEAGTIDHGALTGLGDDDHGEYFVTLSKEFSELGTISVKTGTVRWYPPVNITLTDVVAMIDTAPTGADAIVDVNKDGTTIFTTQSNRPQIAAGTNRDVSGTPDVTAVLTTEYISVDIDQVGSTEPGQDLVVQLRFTRT